MRSTSVTVDCTSIEPRMVLRLSIPFPAVSCEPCANSSASKNLFRRSYSPRNGERHSPPRASVSWLLGWSRCQVQVPGTPSYVAARLRVSVGQPGRRHPLPAGLSRAQKHPAHGALHRDVVDALQKLLEGLSRQPKARRHQGPWRQILDVLTTHQRQEALQRLAEGAVSDALVCFILIGLFALLCAGTPPPR